MALLKTKIWHSVISDLFMSQKWIDINIYLHIHIYKSVWWSDWKMHKEVILTLIAQTKGENLFLARKLKLISILQTTTQKYLNAHSVQESK